MANFIGEDLSGSRFERVDLSGGVDLGNVDIYGEVENLSINGVDLGPLVNAELDRRDPDRAKMRLSDPAGFRGAWDILERLWGGTVERARRLRPELLHESVDGEWSFIETLRHLVFATDSWIRRAILMATVREVIDGMTDEPLDSHTQPVEGPGWPEFRSYPVRECLVIILSEEWEQRLYAERDLDALEARSS